jgi:uncharacterized membrane protein
MSPASPTAPPPQGRQTDTPRRGLRTTTLLILILAPLFFACLVALIGLWPTGPALQAPGTTQAYAGVSFADGTVTQVQDKTCPGDASNRLPDGSIPAVVDCPSVATKLTSGPDRGKTVNLGIPIEVFRSGIRAGAHLQVARYPAQSDTAPVYAWYDFARALPLTVLAVVFALLVVLVARLRGLLALAGLGLAYATIAFFVLPALRHGENATLVAAVGASAIMIVIVYLAHGVSTKSSTALIGTLIGIWLVAGLGLWAASAAHLNGLDSEDNLTISRLTDGKDLSGIVLCGIILAGLGVLNDVTITQASAVWELHEHAPHLNRTQLFASGMRIGRDHLSSTIYTIAFAYAGAALPSLVLINLYGQPAQQVLTSGQVGEEIVRTLVGSIGLILAIPITTALGVAVATRVPRLAGHRPMRPRPPTPNSAPGWDDLGPYTPKAQGSW